MAAPKSFSFDTLSLHAGQQPDPLYSARATSIYQTTSFVFKDTDQGLMERQARDVLYADFKACNDYTAGANAADGVKCPVLAIAGNRDQMTPLRASQELVQRIPHARSVVLDGSGHALMAEQPDAVLDALIAFL